MSYRHHSYFTFLPFLKRLLLMLLPFAILSCGVQKLSERRYKKLINHSPVFEKNFTGFVLYDPKAEQELYAYQGHRYFIPASNTKIFTLFSALQILGDSIPGIRYALAGDSLIFTGTGDPSLLNQGLPASNVYHFLKSSDKKLFYVPSPVPVPHFGPGWAWDDYNDYYSAEKSELPIYGNIARFSRKAYEDTVTVVPRYFADSLIFKQENQASADFVRRSLSSNSFGVNNSPSTGRATAKEVPFKTSPELAQALLSDKLQKPVILLKDWQGSMPHVVYSIPADSLYKRMMQVSDNFIAEQILLLIAGQQSDTLSSDAAIRFITEQYLQDLPDAPQWVDGSGLSRYNLFTPRTLVALWNKLYQQLPQERLFSLLAVGGESGTLKNWYGGTQPYVFAKTGTLSNNHSLSGYIRAKSGKVLIFSFMLNNYTSDLTALKKEMEKVLWQVYEHY